MEFDQYLKSNVITITFLAIKPIVYDFDVNDQINKDQNKPIPVINNKEPGNQQTIQHYMNQISLQYQNKQITEREKESDYYFPSHMKITYSFFDFPATSTGVLTYEGADNE